MYLFLFGLSLSLAACSGDGDETDSGTDGDTEGVEQTEEGSLCAEVACPDHATCDEAAGECLCDEGYETLGERCVAVVPEDGDDADGDDTDGDSSDGDEPDGDEPDGDASDGDDSDGDDEDDTIYCQVPQAPTLTIIHQGAVLAFTADDEGSIQTGTSANADAGEPDTWADTDTVTLASLGRVKVFARLVSDTCTPKNFAFVYEVREGYPPKVGEEGTTAVSKDDASILGWASAVESVNYGEEVIDSWRTPDKALGPAVGTSFDVVCLGRGGDITLSFDQPIANGTGYDFVVFENSFSDDFLELAFVDVSSDGETFLRFDSAYLGTQALAAFGVHDPDLIGGLAGTYRQGYGTPFDLQTLVNRPEVRSGSVDLHAIRYVRLVDIVGDGNAQDSFGQTIFDPYPTVESAGFDLDAVGVLNR